MNRVSILLFTFFYSVVLCAGDIAIGIIGAGPSGLIAAAELKKKGYNNVVVLERSNDVGGKVWTHFHDNKPYEMGAVVTAPDYEITLGIAKDLEQTFCAAPKSLVSKRNGEMVSLFEYYRKHYGIFELCRNFGNFASYVWQHGDFFQPGLAQTPVPMMTNMEAFMNDIGSSSALDILRPIMVGCGYGYAESMPAPYWMKLMKTCAYEYCKKQLSFQSFYYSFADGWQNLFRAFKVAHDIDVRLDTEVFSINRGEDDHGPILVETDKGAFKFDRLIITVPHKIPTLMKLNDEEIAIFQRVEMLTYKVTLAKIDGLPQNTYIWLPENGYLIDEAGEPNDGKPVVISSYHDTNIYQIYQVSALQKNSEELSELMHETIRGIGGDITKIIAQHFVPDYFPHFDVSAFKDGSVARLVAMQGKHGIYYTGALMNFETVELSSQHARALINDYF